MFKTASVAAIFDFRLERLNYFLSNSHPDTSYQVSSQLALRLKRQWQTVYTQAMANSIELDKTPPSIKCWIQELL